MRGNRLGSVPADVIWVTWLCDTSHTQDAVASVETNKHQRPYYGGTRRVPWSPCPVILIAGPSVKVD
jgi:hypothetical protein